MCSFQWASPLCVTNALATAPCSALLPALSNLLLLALAPYSQLESISDTGLEKWCIITSLEISNHHISKSSKSFIKHFPPPPGLSLHTIPAPRFSPGFPAPSLLERCQRLRHSMRDSHGFPPCNMRYAMRRMYICVFTYATRCGVCNCQAHWAESCQCAAARRRLHPLSDKMTDIVCLLKVRS